MLWRGSEGLGFLPHAPDSLPFADVTTFAHQCKTFDIKHHTLDSRHQVSNIKLQSQHPLNIESQGNKAKDIILARGCNDAVLWRRWDGLGVSTPCPRLLALHRSHDLWPPSYSIRHQTSDIKHQASYQFQKTNINHQTSNIKVEGKIHHLFSDIRNQTSNIKNPTSGDKRHKSIINGQTSRSEVQDIIMAWGRRRGVVAQVGRAWGFYPMPPTSRPSPKSRPLPISV